MRLWPRSWDGQSYEATKMMTLIISFYVDQVIEVTKASFDIPKDLQCFLHKNVNERFLLTLSVTTL